MFAKVVMILIGVGILGARALANPCVDCHRNATPGAVRDWEQSRHAQENVGCESCHGSDHRSPEDIGAVRFPDAATCGECHAERVQQHLAGKHAKAWVALETFPSAHGLPPVFVDGQEGCGGCHGLGVMPLSTVERLKNAGFGYGLAPCDACHTRHVFSVEEARSPLACRTCHAGLEHGEWEMFETSKHGVRSALHAQGGLPEGSLAPTCQSCHMPGGDHAVRTAWGSWGIRVPPPSDEAWADDQNTIAKALGLLSPEGEPTWRMDAARIVGTLRMDAGEFESERQRMVQACEPCHSSRFAAAELTKADQVLRETDAKMAEAIDLVAGLYRDGILAKPAHYEYGYPDLLAAGPAPSEIEHRLSQMFTRHRARAFRGAFHNSPRHAWSQGWAELERSLESIRSLAATLRAQSPAQGG